MKIYTKKKKKKNSNFQEKKHHCTMHSNNIQVSHWFFVLVKEMSLCSQSDYHHSQEDSIEKCHLQPKIYMIF